MARGRMISKSLSTSERRAALHHVVPKLAEFCQAVYPLLLAHADDWGCQQGDVFTIKHLVDPTSPRKLTEFELALMALHNVGLITWYQADGKWWVYVRGFAAHQQLHGNERRTRTSPEPPENPSNFDIPAQLRSNSRKSPDVRSKRTELKRTEPIRSEDLGADAPAEDMDPDLGAGAVTAKDVGAFLKRFCELYSQHRHGARYLVKRHKDVPNVRLLLRTYEPRRLEKLVVVLLRTDDEWIERTDRGIGILLVKASWLDGLLAGYEAKHGAIKVAS